MNRGTVDSWLTDGCGRCEHYRTPACKVHLWTDALLALRERLQASGLIEEMKWGSPCYTLDGKNVVMLTAFRDRCALGFFKGALLTDDEGLLRRAGPSSQAARELRFTTVDEVRAQAAAIDRLLAEAVAVERSGAKVAFDPALEPVPDELRERLDTDPALREAFDALTPGRRRSHVIYVSGAKQPATRAARVERCAPKILAGQGFQER